MTLKKRKFFVVAAILSLATFKPARAGSGAGLLVGSSARAMTQVILDLRPKQASVSPPSSTKSGMMSWPGTSM